MALNCEAFTQEKIGRPYQFTAPHLPGTSTLYSVQVMSTMDSVRELRVVKNNSGIHIRVVLSDA